MPAAWGIGLATVTDDGAVLDTYYHRLGWGETLPDHDETIADIRDDLRQVTTRQVRVLIDTDLSPEDASDVYLRLHLLSHRLAKPRSLNLDGAFGKLNNVCWTSLGPVAPDHIDAVQWGARRRGNAPVTVDGVDKFPRMTNYVIPSGVRIADASRVRLGAHLASGTVVMHEGFCNFNAGTLGVSMVEGRISAGVIVGEGSDVGGGASIQGTLSGGGKEQVTIGERCLLGANSGIGISLGNECTVEAGLYLTAGSRVTLPDGTMTRARELSGINGMLFIRNSQSGRVEARPRTGSWEGLNAALHHN